MKSGSMLRVAVVLVGIGAMSVNLSAQAVDDTKGCPNCEATVVLDAADAQAFADALMVINSMPLHGVILDQGVSGGNATVLAATDPDYAARNGLDSFDVAKRVVGFTADARYGIRSVSATWISTLDSGKTRILSRS